MYLRLAFPHLNLKSCPVLQQQKKEEGEEKITTKKKELKIKNKKGTNRL